MRYLFLFLFLASIQLCNAQDEHLARIVSYTGDVTLDGVPVKSNQLIFSSSNKLIISRSTSYAYILTQKGYAMKLESGSYDVQKLEDFIYRKKYKPKPIPTGAVHRDNQAPCPIMVIGIDEYTSNFLSGDSIYLRWKKNEYSQASTKLQPPYSFKVYSIFDDLLSETSVSENAIRINLKRIADKEFNVLIKINENDCQPVLIKFYNSENSSQILKDVSAITADSIQKSILDLVIYDSNNLILDLMFKLDKISKVETTSLPTDIKNYFSSLKTKYEMN